MALPQGQNLVVLVAPVGASRDGWTEVVETIKQHSGDTLFEFVDGNEFSGLTTAEMLDLLSDADTPTYAFLVDERALADSEHPVLAISSFSENQLRVAPTLVLIDCPPSLGRLLLNGLYFADGMILATEAMVDSVRGIENIIETAKFVQKQVNPKLTVKAIVITRREKNGEQDFREQELREAYGELGSNNGLVARTVTPKRAAWGDAHGTGTSVFSLRGDGAMALQVAFTDLEGELELVQTS